MERIIIKIISIFLTSYIVCMIIFKQNYNTYTYYIDVLFFISVIIYFYIKKETFIKINYLLYAYALFISFAIFSSLYSVDFTESTERCIQLFLVLVNMFFLYNAFKKLNLYNSFLNGILLGSFINYLLLLGIIDVPFDTIMPGGGNRFMGTSGNPNVLAVIMIISILSSIIYLKKDISKYFLYYQYVNIFLAIYTIMATVSKKGIIFGSVLLVIFIVTTIKQPKAFLRLLIVVSIASFLIVNFVDKQIFINVIDNIMYRFSAFETQLSSNIDTGSTADRKYMIKTAWEVFQSSPLFGYGLATFAHFNKLGTYAHNNYLELLTGVGIIGTMIFYSMYYFLLKSIMHMYDASLKFIFIFFVFILLVMDITIVSYGSKYLLYTLVFMIAFAEDTNFKVKKNIVGKYEK